MLAPNRGLNLKRFLHPLNLALSIRINCRKWKTAVIELNENSVLISQGIFPSYIVMLHKNTWESWGSENGHKIKFSEFQRLKVMAQLSGVFVLYMVDNRGQFHSDPATYFLLAGRCPWIIAPRKFPLQKEIPQFFKLLDISLWWGIGGWKNCSAVTKPETIFLFLSQTV